MLLRTVLVVPDMRYADAASSLLSAYSSVQIDIIEHNLLFKYFWIQRKTLRRFAACFLKKVATEEASTLELGSAYCRVVSAWVTSRQALHIGDGR